MLMTGIVWPTPLASLRMRGVPQARTMLPSAVYTGLAIADSVAAGRRSDSARRLRYLLKPALMPVLAAAFRQGTRESRGTCADVTVLHTGTAVAQAFSWCGDVALLGTTKRSFLIGVGSFFGAHVAYIVAFASVRGESNDYDTAGLKAALALWLTAAPLMSVAAGRQDRSLQAPVAAYATILSGMFASSRMLDPALPQGPRRTLQTGTALFLVSDSLLAMQKFLLPKPRPILESFVMGTYTAGQGLIAAGVARATIRSA